MNIFGFKIEVSRDNENMFKRCADCVKINWDRYNFSNIHVSDLRFDSKSFEKTNFDNSIIKDTVFESCYFNEASLINVKFINVTFRGCYFNKANLTYSQFNNCLLVDCVLESAILNKAELNDFSTFNVNWENALLNNIKTDGAYDNFSKAKIGDTIIHTVRELHLDGEVLTLFYDRESRCILSSGEEVSEADILERVKECLA